MRSTPARKPTITEPKGKIDSRVVVAAIVVVLLLAFSGVMALRAVDGNATRAAAAADATVPCAQAKNPKLNVRCAVDDELDARSALRDKKEAAAAASAAAADAAATKKFDTDLCVLLTELPHEPASDALRADLKCTSLSVAGASPQATLSPGVAASSSRVPVTPQVTASTASSAPSLRSSVAPNTSVRPSPTPSQAPSTAKTAVTPSSSATSAPAAAPPATHASASASASPVVVSLCIMLPPALQVFCS